MRALFSLYFLLFISPVIQAVELTAESLEDWPEAVCNSGSPANVFIKWQDRNKIAILADGGEVARSEQGFINRNDRLKRSPLHDDNETTRSKQYIYDDLEQLGYSIINVPYCSSDIFMGNHTHEIRGQQVPFKGLKILEAVIEKYRNDLNKASSVLVGGFSAGSIAGSVMLPQIMTLTTPRKRFLFDSYWMDENELKMRQDLIGSDSVFDFVHKSVPSQCKSFLSCYPSEARLREFDAKDSFVVWNRGDLYRLSRDDESFKRLMDNTFSFVSGGISVGRGYALDGKGGAHVLLNAESYGQEVESKKIRDVFLQWLNEGTGYLVTSNAENFSDLDITKRISHVEAKKDFGSGKRHTVVLISDLDCDGNETLKNNLTKWKYNFVWLNHCKGRVRTGDTLNRIRQTNTIAPEQLISDAFEAVSWVYQQPWHNGKVVLIGQAIGGAAINNIGYARNRNIVLSRAGISEDALELVSGMVTYYPFCSLGRMPPETDRPYLSFIAGDDDFENGFGCNVGNSKKRGKMEVMVIDGAKHGFDKETYSGNNIRTGVTKGRVRYTIEYSSQHEKTASERLKVFLSQTLR